MEVIQHRARNVGGEIEDRLHYAAATLDAERNHFSPPKGVNTYTTYYHQNISCSQERGTRNNSLVARMVAEDNDSYTTNAGVYQNI